MEGIATTTLMNTDLPDMCLCYYYYVFPSVIGGVRCRKNKTKTFTTRTCLMYKNKLCGFHSLPHHRLLKVCYHKKVFHIQCAGAFHPVKVHVKGGITHSFGPRGPHGQLSVINNLLR